MSACQDSQDCCIQCPWHCSWPLSTHTSARDSRTPTGKSGLVTCGVTAPFSCAQGFVCAHQESASRVLWKFCNQIPLAFRVKFPGGSQSLCRIPSLGNLLWSLELWQQCENFFGIIVLQVVGSSAQWLCGGANGDLLQEDLSHKLHHPVLLQPEPLSLLKACWSVPSQETLKHSNAGLAQSRVSHKVLFEPSEYLWWVWGLIVNVILPLL